MAVIISGSSGITSVNGSAAAPSVTGTDTDTGIVYGTNTLSLATGGTTAVTVDSSQNVGIGTSSPSQKLEVYGNVKCSSGFIGTTGTNGFALLGTGADTTSGGTVVVRNSSATYNTSGVEFYTNSAERMRIDSSGNVGLGVTPSAWGSAWRSLDMLAASTVATSDSGAIRIGNNFYYNSSNTATYKSGGYAGYYQYYSGNGQHVWGIAPSGSTGGTISFTAAMTLDASGNLLVGTTSLTGSGGGHVVNFSAGNGAYLQTSHTSGASNGYSYHVFYYNGSPIGNIAQSGTTAVTYNTTSDYRLKENVQPLTGALERVAALKPCTYTWKSAPDEIGEGFIAHELAEVCPQAVTGEKDAVKEDGSPAYQGIDTSFLVATLTAAIQEQQAIIEQLKADVAELKAAK